MYYVCIVHAKSKGIGNGLTYESPTILPIGSLVKVTVRSEVCEAIVWRQIETVTTEYDIKLISGIISPVPLLTQTQIELIEWVAAFYMCSLTLAVKLWLPGISWSKLLPASVLHYGISTSTLPVKGPKKSLVLSYIQSKQIVTKQELVSHSKASSAIIKNLLASGHILEKEIVPEYAPIIPNTSSTIPPLTGEQNEVYTNIKKATKPVLLFGVTGSGKTEIYCHLVKDALEASKQAIILVPEIFLTEHLLIRYETYFKKESIAVIHSKLTLAARIKLWKQIKQGEKLLIIGSRSALFYPLENIGTIIIDEEHEWTYKQESAPRYHARTVAEQMAIKHIAVLVVGSATPSLESFYKTKQHVYELVTLANRFNNAPMPAVQVVDLLHTAFEATYPFTKTLIAAIQDRLAKKEQVILFLNRRGLATSLVCTKCRRRVTSPVSQLPFTVHKGTNGQEFLLDHTSNLKAPLPTMCPFCSHTELKQMGAGTQRIEILTKHLFPSANVLRIDKDSLSALDNMQEILADMQSGKADILLGTQAVVKGLDFSNVTLAGVLIADTGLSLPHFRAGERVFQLLTQLTGRSGRHKPGEVIIQTWRPDAPEIKFASQHNTIDYLNEELKMRMHLGYPPCVPMVRLLARGPKAVQIIQKMFETLTAIKIEKNYTVTLQKAPTFFGGGEVWHILARGPDAEILLTNVSLDSVHIDIEPYDCI